MYRSHTRFCAPVGAHSGAPACFATHARSFLIRGYFCHPNPNKVFAYAHKSFIGWQPPLIVVLACGSLGLIGLSHFLQPLTKVGSRRVRSGRTSLHFTPQCQPHARIWQHCTNNPQNTTTIK